MSNEATIPVTQFVDIVAKLTAQKAAPEHKEPVDIGPRIVVIDRGWVLIGKVTQHHDHVVINTAKCIQRWGTTQGLGQLVTGPTGDTIAHPMGDVEVPNRAVIFTMQVDASPWGL